ncbi:MAG: HAD family hydrolase [Chloroflexota bacterium]
MARIDAILWDIDGTLLTGKGIGREATRRSMEQVFGTSTGIDTHHFGGKTDYKTLALLLEPAGYDESAVGEKMPAFAQAMAANMRALTATYDVVALPGAMNTLNALLRRENLLHGLVTGNVAPAAPVKLQAAGYDPAVFTFGAFGDESVHREDLPPAAITRASELAGRSIAPEHVLIIGDTLMDITAARASGVKVCAVATGYNTRDELAAAEPDYLINEMAEFNGVVQID